MTALIAWLLANPVVIAVLGGIAAALGFGFQQRRAGAKAERNRQRAKEADAYEDYLDRVAAANRARNDLDPDSVSSDPHNRDNRH